jgi:MFS family permease
LVEMPATASAAVIQPRIVRVLATAQVLSGIGTSGTVAAGSLLVSSLSHSATLAGLAQTFSVLGAALMAIPLARLTNRGGRRLALTSGYVVGSFGASLAILGGALRSLPVVFVGALLLGAASASSYQARFAAIDLATPESRARNLSVVVWGSTVGAVAGPNLITPSGSLAHLFGLPRLVGPYILAASTLMISLAVIRLFLRPDPYIVANQNAETGVMRAQLPMRQVLGIIRRNRRALLGVSAVAIGHLVMVGVMVMTPVHMKQVDVTLTIIGLVISIHILGMFAFSPLVGWLSDRWGRVRSIQIGVILLIAAVVTAGTAQGMNTWQLGAGLFMLGLGWSFTLISGSTLLSESVNDEVRSSTQGTSDLIMNLMGAAGGAVAGVIIGLLNYHWLCGLAMIPVAMLAVGTIVVAGRR